MKAHQLQKLTVAEYIQHEIDTDQQYEYHDGKIYALAGGSINHGLLCGNIYAEIRNELKKKKSNCKAFTSEVKLNIKEKNSFVYPDTMVVCGNIETSIDDRNAVSNPILVVEVLSKSTAEYDRGDKFYFYRQIPTLQEYVLIDQSRYVVEVFYKKENNDLWSISRYKGLDAIIQLQSIHLSVSMNELYFDIEIQE
ncbi:MAG: Uma2 family endonuclease [Aureispira sp.]